MQIGKLQIQAQLTCFFAHFQRDVCKFSIFDFEGKKSKQLHFIAYYLIHCKDYKSSAIYKKYYKKNWEKNPSYYRWTTEHHVYVLCEKLVATKNAL